VYIDSREPRERYQYLIDVLKIPTEFKYLDVGDVIIGDWCIEAKSIKGFLNDVMDRRLFKQAIELANCCRHSVIVITELAIVQEKYRPVLYGAMASLMARFNIPVVSVPSEVEYNMLLAYLYSQVVGKPSGSILPAKRPQKIKDAQELMLQCIKGLGRSRARHLLEMYGTLENIARLQVHELARVKGISERIANNIWKVFHTRYGSDEVFE